MIKQAVKGLCFAVALWLVATAPAWAQDGTPMTAFHPQEWLRHRLLWVQDLGAIGAIVFILLYMVATVAFLPGSVLTLGAGAVFGVFVGTIYVFVGATLGATLAFLVGRYLVRGWVAVKLANHKRFQAIDEAVGREGFKIVLLTRLSPLFPFNFLNYAFGITAVSLKDYCLGCIGMIPGTLLFVYVGSLAGNLAMLGTSRPPVNPVLEWTMRLIGLVATVAVTVYVTRIARNALESVVGDAASEDPTA
ncbi:TVP38/TMEM64 family protein [Oculatella sp. LEGE 06141]|uniref:TVP38/TMEM64 family protein n=1 Tax=Oculatella sp. LEGE 06141 TaxID=1828648 RepID=UPI001D147D7F|nr:TVP38/TMEM64 family protein [Oculatella sp. LEGE 06141]